MTSVSINYILQCQLASVSVVGNFNLNQNKLKGNFGARKFHYRVCQTASVYIMQIKFKFT